MTLETPAPGPSYGVIAHSVSWLVITSNDTPAASRTGRWASMAGNVSIAWAPSSEVQTLTLVTAPRCLSTPT